MKPLTITRKPKATRMNCVRYRIAVSLLACLLAIAASACVSAPDLAKNDEQVIREVRAVIEAQQVAWNRGDIEGFMDGYERAESTTFVSGEDLTRGWQTVLERYKQHYNSRAQMGTLTFSELDIKPVSPLFALADGRWQLTRADDAPHGRFTLVFRRITNDWRIIHDTTTSATQ